MKPWLAWGVELAKKVKLKVKALAAVLSTDRAATHKAWRANFM